MNRIPLTRVDALRFLIAASLACGFALTVATAGTAADPAPALLTVNWKDRAAEGLVPNGEVIDLTEQRPFDDTHALKVVSPTRPGETAVNPVIALTTIDSPAITKQSFALTGWIKHTGIEGAGYLEMWTIFPDGSQYFSRTLGTTGPMQSFTGDSDWRTVLLSFQLSDDPQAPKPSRLIVNAVLPGAGELVLSDLTLKQDDSIAAVTKPRSAWWNDRTGGLVGGIGGSLIGLIGAAIGVMASLGRGRPVVLALLVAAAALGGLLFISGIVAASLGQPYGVFYPLLLGGFLCEMLATIGLVVIRQRYAQIEMRRMQALDA